eukprot:6211835-Pleurochrysis_carterae.AAC.2
MHIRGCFAQAFGKTMRSKHCSFPAERCIFRFIRSATLKQEQMRQRQSEWIRGYSHACAGSILTRASGGAWLNRASGCERRRMQHGGEEKPFTTSRDAKTNCVLAENAFAAVARAANANACFVRPTHCMIVAQKGAPVSAAGLHMLDVGALPCGLWRDQPPSNLREQFIADLSLIY